MGCGGPCPYAEPDRERKPPSSSTVFWSSIPKFAGEEALEWRVLVFEMCTVEPVVVFVGALCWDSRSMSKDLRGGTLPLDFSLVLFRVVVEVGVGLNV